tara:strand:+ start:237 stop:1028 length:792 start_codon:yes stop_codon:yes gene_type:complete
MKKKIISISGVTLIEILIGIVISVIMMAAMFTSYQAVNNTYSQVIDRAKISQTGRDIIGMLTRDIRMAGFKYFDDTTKSPSNYVPILITKSSGSGCDKIELTYGDRIYDASKTPAYTFVTYKVTYECKASKIIDKKTKIKIDAYGIYKSKSSWDGSNWVSPSSSTDDLIYKDELIVDHVQDLIFIPIDEKGKRISPPPKTLNDSNKIKIVDIAFTTRSQKEFFRKAKKRDLRSLGVKNSKGYTDKFLRDSIVVSAHTRNMGLQ